VPWPTLWFLRFESDGCLGKVTNLDELGV
jgi:hypothetical protein